MRDTTEVAEEREHPIMRREAEYWTIAFGGVRCLLRDGRGLHHLARLLTHPGTEISALSLERDGNPGPLNQAPVPLHDARERARVNVRRAITAVLRRLGTHHPALARHLADTVKTGAFCSYDPTSASRCAERGEAASAGPSIQNEQSVPPSHL